MLFGVVTLVAFTYGGGTRPLPLRHQQPAQVTAQMSDARILGILGAADADEIEAATLATKKASTGEVRSYATLLMRDHQQSLHQNTVLAKQLRLNRLLPADSTMTRAHKAEMDQLNLLSTGEFDKAFVQSMVADHQTIINQINSTLLAQATRAAVKAFIRRTRPVLESHLTKGQQWLDKHK